MGGVRLLVHVGEEVIFPERLEECPYVGAVVGDHGRAGGGARRGVGRRGWIILTAAGRISWGGSGWPGTGLFYSPQVAILRV